MNLKYAWKKVIARDVDFCTHTQIYKRDTNWLCWFALLWRQRSITKHNNTMIIIIVFPFGCVQTNCVVIKSGFILLRLVLEMKFAVLRVYHQRDCQILFTIHISCFVFYFCFVKSLKKDIKCNFLFLRRQQSFFDSFINCFNQ